MESGIASVISGSGFAVPEKVIANAHFESYLDTSDEWIKDRTGIAERRWAEPGVGVTALAESAARQAVERAGLGLEDIDGIVFATVTPDIIFPSSAAILQGKLGIRRGFAFDVNAVCSGFIYALSVAHGMLVSRQARNVLVVGADVFSRLVDPQDRTTCVLFGDGAGALVLSATEPTGDDRARGILSLELGADGAAGGILTCGFGSRDMITAERIQAGEHFVKMQGREVFKLAVRSLCEVSERVLARAGTSAARVDWFVSHQANKRILDSMAKYLGVEESRVLANVARYGNTSAASVPILLAESVAQGTIKKGDLVLLSAFGGGLTWGAILLRI